MSRILKNYTNKITSLYGYRILNGVGTGHGGIDIVGTTGNSSLLDYITAHSDGIVTKAINNITGFVKGGSYGNYVIIKHDEVYSTLYAHMRYDSVTLNVGDNVKAGDVIGYMGATGTSYGGHLHFEVRQDNVKIDPTGYIDSDLPIQKSEEIILEEDDDMAVIRYVTISEMPVWAREAIQHLMTKGYISDTDNLDLSLDMIRVFVVNYRAGLYN